MIGLGIGRPIFLATGVTDLRSGMNRLYALILDQLGQEPLSGALFCFANRRRETVKLFWFDEGGVWVAAKRLESGTFRWPGAGARTVALTAADLPLLLSGVDPTRTRLRRWWTPVDPAPGPSAPAVPVPTP
ncbi:MAG TPA: IS66 family insertion sequence element accessory protein TnpB [Gemmatirosa sp.]